MTETAGLEKTSHHHHAYLTSSSSRLSKLQHKSTFVSNAIVIVGRIKLSAELFSMTSTAGEEEGKADHGSFRPAL